MIIKVRDGMLEFVEKASGNVEKVKGIYAEQLGCSEIKMEAVDLTSMSGFGELMDSYVNLAKSMNCAVIDKGVEIQDLM